MRKRWKKTGGIGKCCGPWRDIAGADGRIAKGVGKRIFGNISCDRE